jgi:hypothetical protein
MGYRKLPPLVIPDDVAVLGYIAGLIDGEGHIGITSSFDKKKSKNPSHAARVVVTNCDARLVQWLHRSVGGGLVEVDHKQRDRWRTCYRWVLNGQNAEDMLRAVMSYLVIKREQAEIVLQLRATGRGAWRGRGLASEVVAEREALKVQINLLNKRGVG